MPSLGIQLTQRRGLSFSVPAYPAVIFAGKEGGGQKDQKEGEDHQRLGALRAKGSVHLVSRHVLSIGRAHVPHLVGVLG